jgi:hypothetical protein
VSQVLLADGGARPPSVGDELFTGHFLLLLGVVSISGQHDDCVGQREKFISVVVEILVGFVEGQGELPNDPFDLLGLAWQSEFAEKQSHGFVELHIFEIEEHAERVKNGEDFLVIFSEVLSHDGFVDALSFDEVGGDGVGRVLVDEALGDVVLDGVLRLFVEHHDEQFCFLIVLLVLLDVIELIH